LGAKLTNHNCTNEEHYNFGNFYYHSFQNLVSLLLLSENIKFKYTSIYRAVILSVFSYGCVAVQITAALNCLNSSVVEHKLLPGNITCWPYTDTLAADRLVYLSWQLRKIHQIY